MIPKIIHYCWFGKGLMPKSQKDCIKGWKKLMPDYKIMRWDESNFDVNQYESTRLPYAAKKYAYVADVCRFNVLAEFGGIYLDTDVEVFKRFDDFLDCNFFSGIELYRDFEKEHIAEQYLNEDGTVKDPTQDVPHFEILTSTIGCAPNNPAICKIRDFYNNIYIDQAIMESYREHFNLDRLVARYLTQYGFKYKDETQHFGNKMVVYGTGTFGHAFCPTKTYSISYHHNAATWNSEKWDKKRKRELLLDKMGMLSLYKKLRAFKKKL